MFNYILPNNTRVDWRIFRTPSWTTLSV